MVFVFICFYTYCSILRVAGFSQSGWCVVSQGRGVGKLECNMITNKQTNASIFAMHSQAFRERGKREPATATDKEGKIASQAANVSRAAGWEGYVGNTNRQLDRGN
jgi:hypothetical protein